MQLFKRWHNPRVELTVTITGTLIYYLPLMQDWSLAQEKVIFSSATSSTVRDENTSTC